MALIEITDLFGKAREMEEIALIVKLKYAKYVEENGKQILLCKVVGKHDKELNIVISNQSDGVIAGKNYAVIEKLKYGSIIKCNVIMISIPDATEPLVIAYDVEHLIPE